MDQHAVQPKLRPQNPACPFSSGTHEVLSGRVVSGDGRGRSLGFPTANLALVGAVLQDGVYAACVRLPDGRQFHASISVGNNPTFGDVHEQRVEAFVHSFDGDLYGQDIQVVMISRLRDMCKYDTVDELIAQTQRDIAVSEAILATCGLIEGA